MSYSYQDAQKKLLSNPKSWLVTGVAGFIGSHLLEFLLSNHQIVVGIDNFSTGTKQNLKEVQKKVTSQQWKKFIFFQGDVCSLATCQKVCVNIDYVLHQAGVSSVMKSIEKPLYTHEVNVNGFLNLLSCAYENKVKSFIFASSAASYGNDASLLKNEEIVGEPLSPYAVTKRTNELYAQVFGKIYDLNLIGLRYFNIFGPRQNIHGGYAAVIPLWISSMLNNRPVFINGNGKTTRDFCFIDDVIQANILAALAPARARNQIYNVGTGQATSLIQLLKNIKELLASDLVLYTKEPIFRDFQIGDLKYSQANIQKIEEFLGYQPNVSMIMGLKKTIQWYLNTRVFEAQDECNYSI